VAPEVKTISRASAETSAASCSRARSTASSARQPYACVRLAAFPNSSLK